MTASQLVDGVKIVCNSTGTGALSLGAAVPGFRGIEALTNGAQYSYAIQVDGDYEWGTGTYLAVSDQMSRSPIWSSQGGAPINLSANAQISFVALAEDLFGPAYATAAQAAAIQTAADRVQTDLDASQTAQDRAAVEAAALNIVNDIPYPPAYSATLPQGLTNITIGGTAITGATPGTYALTPVGGSISGVVANLIVDTATTAHIVIVHRGLGTGTTPPTFANPTGATLPTGTTLTGVVGSLIADQEPYWVASSDGQSTSAYANSGGSVVTYPIGGTQLQQGAVVLQPIAASAISAEAGAIAAMSSLSVPQTQVVGRPAGTNPVNGSAALGGYTYFMNDAATVTASSWTEKFFTQAGVSGTIRAARYSLNATTSVMTLIQASAPQNASGGSGGQLNTLTFSDLGTINPGDIIAFVPSANGVITSTASTPPDGKGWGFIASALPSSGTPTSGGNSRLETSFTLSGTLQTVTSATFASLKSEADVTQGVANGASAIANQLVEVVTQTVGRPAGTPIDAAQSGGGLTYYFADAATITGPFAVQFYCHTGSTFQMARCDANGNVLQKSNILNLTPGPQSHSTTDLSLSFQAGDVVGIYIGTSGGFTSSTSTPADGAGWYYASGSFPSSPTRNFVSTTRLEMSIVITGTRQPVTAANFDALTVSVANAKGTGAGTQPFIIQAGYQIGKLARQGLTGYGQSNSVSHNATPLVDTTASVHHLMPNVGIVMTKPGISGGTNPDDGTENALLNKTGIQDPGGGGTTAGESIFPWIAKRATPLIAAECAYTPKFWCSSAGLSSAGIATIGYGTAWYANLRYHWSEAAARAAAAGESYAAVVTYMDHGETDSGNSMPYATYKADIAALIDGSTSDRLADFGQTQPMHWLFTTPSYNIATSADTSMAIMDLCAPYSDGGRPDCHFVAPMYRFPLQNGAPSPTSDHIHLTAVGQALKGCYYARATAQLFANRVPDRCRWLGAFAQGTAFTVYIQAPTAVAFNTTILGAATNMGIRITDGTGDLTLSALACGTAVWNAALNAYVTPITAMLNRALGSNPTFRYAIDYLGTGVTIVNGASGNVFDTTPDTVTISGTSYSLAHAAPPCRKAVVVID